MSENELLTAAINIQQVSDLLRSTLTLTFFHPRSHSLHLSLFFSHSPRRPPTHTHTHTHVPLSTLISQVQTAFPQLSLGSEGLKFTPHPPLTAYSHSPLPKPP